jgi:hypothetical protein
VYCDQLTCKYRKWCLFKESAKQSARE